jgi:predicted ester cyclase
MPRRKDVTAMGNVEVVRAAMQLVFGEHRLEEINRFWAADFVQYSSHWGPGGRQELREVTARLVAGMPDLAATLDHALAAGDLVVTFTTWTGTVRGDLPDFGIKAAGQRLDFRTADIFKVRNGQITAHWDVIDTGPLVKAALVGPDPEPPWA